MSSFQVSNIEPFLYAAAPINASPDEAAQKYYSVRGALEGGGQSSLQAAVPPQQASPASTQINEQAVEGYMNRILEALQADIAALDARITALEP